MPKTINRLISKIFIIWFCFFWGLTHISSTVGNFTSSANNQANTISSGCWQAPTPPTLLSPADNSSSNADNVDFIWNPSSSDCPIATVTYRFQLNNNLDFTAPLINTSFSDSLTYLYSNIPEGEYWWRVQAKDQFDNISTSSVYHLIIDRTAPTVSLSISGSWNKVVDEKINNGSFETGDLTGWRTAGEVQVLNSDTIDEPPTAISPPEGDWMVRIGNPDDPGNYVWENRLMQSFDNGPKSFSLSYNFFSRDFIDTPGFFIRLNGQEIFRLNNLNSDGFSALNTDWQEFYYDLTNYPDPKINLSIYSGNTNDNFSQSWVYIDKITTYFIAASPSANYTLTAVEPQPGSGIDYCQSKIDDNDWQTGNSFNITSPGQHSLQYHCLDQAGNSSPIYQVTVITDAIAPSEVSDLSVLSTAENNITLSWTAPGNDGITGKASQYDIRYSSTTTDCSSFNFDSATKVEKIPSPLDSEETEILEVFGLNPGTKYCFGLKAADEAPNWSGLSNIAQGTTASGLTVNPGDVVINELMWMGSSVSSADEWLELRNMTDHDINLSGFKLTKLSGGIEVEMAISFAGKSIPAHGYFLIGNSNSYAAGDSQLNVTPDIWDSSLDLSDDNLQISLYWNDGAVDYLIDSAWDGTAPTEGLYETTPGSEKYYSMERTSIPGDGTNPLNWYTCIDSASTTDFFDGGADERGTPGAANRSENEPLAHQNLINRSLLPTITKQEKQSSPPATINQPPEISYNISNANKSLSFTVKNLINYIKLSYQLTYDSNNGPQGIIGEVDLKNQEEYSKKGVIFGTCSNGGTCVYHSKISNIQLKITLEDKNHHIYKKTQSIN